jgi:Uma2 family endonuclease
MRLYHEREGRDTMSTLTLPQPVASPVDMDWVPSSLYRVTIEQFQAMVPAGAFAKRDRVSLLNGYLVTRMTELPPHGAVRDAVDLTLGPVLPRGWYIRSERVLRIPGFASLPVPDLVVVRGTWRDYVSRYPEPVDTALVVEVGHTSLSEDRAMAGIYGAGGVPAYWIINLVDRQVEVYSDPGPGGYGSRQDYHAGDVVPVMIAGHVLPQIAVNDLLP